MPSQGPSLKDLFDRLNQQGGPGNIPRPGTSLVDRLARWGRRALVVAAVVLVVALLVCYWWFHPSLNLGSVQVWMWIVGICVVGLLALWVASERSVMRTRLNRRLMIVPAAPENT